MGGIVNNPQLQQAVNTAGQFPQQPGQVQQPRNPFAGFPLNHPLNRFNTFFQGLPIRPGFGGNQLYAGGNPNFDERTGTYINPRFPGMLQGGFPQQPQAQQLVDPRQSGLASLAGLNGVPGNQNPLYFGPGYK